MYLSFPEICCHTNLQHPPVEKNMVGGNDPCRNNTNLDPLYPSVNAADQEN